MVGWKIAVMSSFQERKALVKAAVTVFFLLGEM